jgi:hypothetical protein
VVQRPALAVAMDLGEGEDALLSGRQQLLAGEFGRGVEVEWPPLPVRTGQLGGEGMQVRLVAGRHLQGRRLHLDEAPRLEPAADRPLDAAPRQQERAPVLMLVGVPPGAWICGVWHGLSLA